MWNNCSTSEPKRRGAPVNMPALVVLFAASSVAAQQRSIEPKDVQVFNRSVSALSDGTRKGVRLNEQPGEGVAYLKGIEFSNGTIEFDVRGKDVQGQSFVGVAFHGLDSTTYDAIYLRPFNFRTEDPTRHSHAVQYISHPTYTWQKLRAERPGAFEQPVSPAPDPNAWFHVRVVVASPKVSVFVGDAKQPSLVVTQLSDRTKGLVGLWVGNGSGGDLQGCAAVVRGAERVERWLRRVARGARGREGRPRRPPHAELPAGDHRSAGCVESWRGGRPVESVIVGGGAGARPGRHRRPRGRGAEPVLSQDQTPPAWHRARSRDRDEHQGVLAAPAPARVHLAQGTEGRGPGRAGARGRVVSGGDPGLPRGGAAARRPEPVRRRVAHAHGRHDGGPEGGPAATSRRADGGPTAQPLVPADPQGMGRRHRVRVPTVSRRWERGHSRHGAGGAKPGGAHPQPQGPERSPADDPAGASRRPPRRPYAL